MRSVFVTTIVPWPEDSGNRRRMSSVIRALAELGPVDLFVMNGGATEAPPGSLPVERVGVGPSVRQEPTATERLRWLLREPEMPSELVGLRLGPTRASFRAWAESTGESHSLVWYNRPLSYLAAGPLADASRIVDLDDLEDLKLVGRLEGDIAEHGTWSGPRFPGWRRIARHKLRRNVVGWQRLQSTVAEDADRVVVCSDEDRELSGLPRTYVLPNCYPVPEVPLGRETVGDPPTLLLLGLMTYRPNADGADWFAREVLPRLRRKIPSVRLRIVGAAGGTVQPLDRIEGVTVTGPVATVDEELRRADLAVVPVRFGGGTRLKILEAWAHRLPVVSTTIGATGLGARDDIHLLLADDPENFARACARVLLDDQLRRRLVRDGQTKHEQDFSCDRLASSVAALAAQLTREGR